MSVGAVNKNTGDRIPTAGMPAIDDALDLTSVNPVQNAVITAALALKQDKTDNSLQTTDKTVVGAINEHEGDIGSLKSGLTNYENQNNLNLEVPNRKNILNLSFEKIKALCTEGTWTGTTYVYNGVTYVFTVVDGYITKISISGKLTSNRSRVWIAYDEDMSNYSGCILNGCPDLGGASYMSIIIQKSVTPYTSYAIDAGSGANIGNITSNSQMFISIGESFDSQTPVDVYPMIRPATISDATFAPYIPSVESRIEAVENATSNNMAIIKINNPTTGENHLSYPTGYNRSNTVVVTGGVSTSNETYWDASDFEYIVTRSGGITCKITNANENHTYYVVVLKKDIPA